jgi:2-amino-4-hydroxy-6-hydroxymethyldihydropteridine diphosphokinase
MNNIYLLLGSNDGDRMELLGRSIELIEDTCGKVVQHSQIYETAAWGLEDQPDFLNMAIHIQSILTPEQLLQQVQSIEAELGRQRTVVWGQRTLDIDILFYNDDVIELPHLHIPHPYMAKRRFVLGPLNDIAADFIHPVYHATVGELLNMCEDKLPIHPYKQP